MGSEKVILITGASSGMGWETALYLAKQGYKVYAGTRNTSAFDAIDLANLTPVYLDITSSKNIQEVIQQIKDQSKHIDVLINNAGYGLVSTVENLQEEEMFTQYNINVFGLLRMCQAVIPSMREQQEGIIINISSFLGKVGLPLLTFYNSSKYAVEGITDSLRYELHDFNIRVHSLMPGFFDTNFARDNLVTNLETFKQDSPYAKMVEKITPKIVEQINEGNNAKDVAFKILDIIEDKNFPARATIGDKAKKFIPMRKELSDEDFERRVRDYYNLD